MIRPPHSLKAGVFTKELIIDKFVYGIWMGVIALVCYIVVIEGVGDGDLGHDCNESYNETCDLTYRARSTAYAIITMQLSIMAWEAKHMTLGLWNMDPSGTHGVLQVFPNIYKNKFLFWSVVVGIITPFPAIFIPVINRQVFRHNPISWEWGLVMGSNVLFVAGCEAYKAAKRKHFSNLEKRREVVVRTKQGEKSEESSINTV